MSILTHTLGYPRIGPQRELKSALEGYWNGSLSADVLQTTAQTIKRRNWQEQIEAGIDIIPSNDFSLYDHVLDTACLVGAVPKSYRRDPSKPVSLEQYFAMARGQTNPAHICDATHTAIGDAVALPLRKWFNTNYHYIVPAFTRDQEFRMSSTKPFDEFSEALAQSLRTKPVLLGPVSFLQLGSCDGEPFDRLELLPRLLPIYANILAKLKELGAQWVQIDEPILVLDLRNRERHAIGEAYSFLQQGMRPKILLGTYFGELHENLPLALHLPIDALHIDATHGEKDLAYALEHLPDTKTLSIGIVDGKNIWKNDLQQSLELLGRARSQLGSDRLLIAPSCSLLHVPITVTQEEHLDPALRSRLAFAREKLSELTILRDALRGFPPACNAVTQDTLHRQALAAEENMFAPFVGYREKELPTLPRRISSKQRATIQRESLHLPAFPTTTIGSFPQTKELRKLRADAAKGHITPEEYRSRTNDAVRRCIVLQEDIGLDVLVHGEPERSDMVEYFAERLHGMACTEHGWVQSYGSRCIRPPIIFDQVIRGQPMTVETTRYAQSCTEKPVKGMLTGPATLLKWSFPHEDQPPAEICSQLALAVRDEIRDLQDAGIHIIQIDEPALREGLPLRRADRERYLQWATACIRLAASSALPTTQIHTHMCYADFQDIAHILADLDVDVISLEAARSRMALLQTFASLPLPQGIGPGIWDVHSPRTPSEEEMLLLLHKALAVLLPEQLWLNPDCGLKTRREDEVVPALRNMVAAAHALRKEFTPSITAATPSTD